MTCAFAFAVAVGTSLVVITASSSGAATPGFVQQASVTPAGAVTSAAVAYKSVEAAGNTNVVVIGWGDATSSISTVRDSAGNAYQVAAPVARGSGLSQAIYYAANIKAAAAGSNTVTVTFSPAVQFSDVRVLEYNGLDTAAPFDETVSASGSSTSVSSGAVTTSSANELLVGGGTTSAFFTGAGTGFVVRVITPAVGGSTANGDIAEDRSVSATGSYSATATQNKVKPWVMQLATFRASTTNPPPTTTTTTTLPSGQGTPGFVQQASATPAGAVTSAAVAYKSAQAAGDTNVVVIGWGDTTSSIATVRDSAGNSYQVAAPVARGTGLSQAIYYAANIKAAAAGSNTVTVHVQSRGSVLGCAGLGVQRPRHDSSVRQDGVGVGFVEDGEQRLGDDDVGERTSRGGRDDLGLLYRVGERVHDPGDHPAGGERHCERGHRRGSVCDRRGQLWRDGDTDERVCRG